MILTKKQEQGLKIAVDRYRKGEKYTAIAGYAGSGKTSTVKFIISALNLAPEDVCYIAYTGKAALVLKERGCLNAKTAHKLLYRSIPLPDGTFMHVPKPVLDENYKLIVIDEVSMLPDRMWNLLLSHNVHVIALGDPGQLPAVGEDNDVLEKPHIFLDEIMRQAKESEIIRLSMDIREEKTLTLFKGNEVRVINRNEICSGLYSWADQIITGTNRSKDIVNSQMREILNYPKDIVIDGDKVICLKNDWRILSNLQEPLVNGETGFVKRVKLVEDIFLNYKYIFDFYPDSFDNEAFFNLTADEKLFRTGVSSITKNNYFRIPKELSQSLKQFDFGYCITCWKAQGSEYNKVLFLVEPNFPIDRETYKRYLYTGITRAKSKLVLVKNVTF